MSQVNSSISKGDLESAIRRVLANDKIVVERVSATIPALGGEHYLSEVEYCDVDIDDGRVKRQVNLFVKKEINEGKLARGLPTTAFDSEILIYDVLMKHVAEFCKKNASTAVDLGFFPLCFYTGVSGSEKLIAMENLISAGYKMHAAKLVSQDLNHAKLVVTSLATFHAVTFVMERTHNVNLADRYNLKTAVGESTTVIQSLMSAAMKITINVLKDIPDCQEIVRKLEKFEPRAWNKYVSYCRPGNGINVLCHGDCWNNNMLFLYNGNNEPVSVKLVDWQLSHCGPIGKDLCHYLYMSVKPEIQRKHLQEILQAYYDRFRQVAQSLGAGTDVMISYAQFLKEYKTCKLFGLMKGSTAIVMTPVMAGLEREKAKDSSQKFDVTYLQERAADLPLSTLLSQEEKDNLREMVTGCEEELTEYLLEEKL